MQSEADSRIGLEVRRDADVEARRDRKFWIAMGIYGLLAALCWFTLGEGSTSVLGRRVEIRWIPIFVIGTFVFRTWMAREAEKIRRRSQQ